MKRIFDPALLDFYLQKYEIPSLFNTPDLAFSLYQFEKGERLDILNPEEYLSFLVNGSIEISANRADGTSFTCIGDMEFCGKRDDTHQIEARTTALCIVLPLGTAKEFLLDDNRFLRYLLTSVTEKLMLYSSSQSNFSTLEEAFLSYLSKRCPDQTFSGVEKMAMQLCLRHTSCFQSAVRVDPQFLFRNFCEHHRKALHHLLHRRNTRRMNVINARSNLCLKMIFS